MLKKEELPECPVATTVQLIGNKWKLLILRNLRMRPWRFNELQKSLKGISQKVLTESLRSMEADGIIVRTIYAEVPPRVEYSLSELGETMRPILDAMEKWGNDYKASLKATSQHWLQWQTNQKPPVICWRESDFYCKGIPNFYHRVRDYQRS